MEKAAAHWQWTRHDFVVVSSTLSNRSFIHLCLCTCAVQVEFLATVIVSLTDHASTTCRSMGIFFCLCLSCDICLKINWRHELKERDEKKTNSNLRMVKFKCFYSLVWKHVSFSLHLNYIKSQLKWAKIMNFILIRDTWSFGMQIAVVFGIWDSAAFEAKLCWSLASMELASD